MTSGKPVRDVDECRSCAMAERDHDEKPCVDYLTSDRTRCPYRQAAKREG